MNSEEFKQIVWNYNKESRMGVELYVDWDTRKMFVNWPGKGNVTLEMTQHFLEELEYCYEQAKTFQEVLDEIN